jgi:hypothetical protein
VVSCDTTNKTGELDFKAATLSSSTDYGFYIYYDNPNVSDYVKTATYGSENVWTNGYGGVWHLQQNPSSSIMVDSSSNQNQGTTYGGMTSSESVQGKLSGNALAFDGNDDYVGISDGGYKKYST